MEKYLLVASCYSNSSLALHRHRMTSWCLLLVACGRHEDWLRLWPKRVLGRCPPKVTLRMGDLDLHLMFGSLGHVYGSLPPDGILIGSVFFAWYIRMPNTQTIERRDMSAEWVWYGQIISSQVLAFSALTLLVWAAGRASGPLRVVGYWCGYLSGARCRLAYCPADATATHCLLLQ